MATTPKSQRVLTRVRERQAQAAAEFERLAIECAQRAFASTLKQLRAIEDPALRFRVVRALDPLVKAELASVGRDVVAELSKLGLTYGDVAAELGISRQRAHQLGASQDDLPDEATAL